jgi:dipeptidyl-peptidase 4
MMNIICFSRKGSQKEEETDTEEEPMPHLGRSPVNRSAPAAASASKSSVASESNNVGSATWTANTLRPQNLTAEAVAALPPPGLSGPTSLVFSPCSSEHKYLAFLSSSLKARSGERQLQYLNVTAPHEISPLLKLLPTSSSEVSLEERLRRERQRLHASHGITQFTWQACTETMELLLLVPIRGSVYVQRGIADGELTCIYDKASLQLSLPEATPGSVVGRDAGAIDPQLSPDGTMVAFVVAGDIYVASTLTHGAATRVTFGALQDSTTCITHGLADFVAQEEMDRYRGFWWAPDSNGILLSRVDESHVPPYRISHQGRDLEEETYEDHRYPFAGKLNPKVQLGYVQVNRDRIRGEDMDVEGSEEDEWARCKWFPPPREATEYLARVMWFPDGSACAQWQNRTQSTLVLVRLDVQKGTSRTLHLERSDVWINLHHMLRVLPKAIHPDDCGDYEINLPPMTNPLPAGSFSFLFASEQTGYFHLYLYTFVPGINNERAMLIRTISGGEWMVESIVGIDMDRDTVYVTGTYDSPLERHLYALPITGIAAAMAEEEHGGDNLHGGVRRSLKNVMSALSGNKSGRQRSDTGEQPFPTPVRLTADLGMHSIVMDDECSMFTDTSSDLGRPTSVKVFRLPDNGPFLSSPTASRGRKQRKQQDEYDGRTDEVRLMFTLYDAAQDDNAMTSLLGAVANELSSAERLKHLPAPELMSFPTADGTETLHAALYRPDPRLHGPGPYPLVCAVYGGPHVQRVNRSWSQCADMRAQRLRSLGFAVVKCDNRGSSRRGLGFEAAIRHRLGRLEVLDQVTTVRQLTMRGIADANRVGIYGWSYGGYLSAMCLCRAPDVFHIAVAGAPVTSWDGYDTHYTERYMGLPADNPSGYRESAVFDHVSNMRGKLMIVHGLIDENVHFRHTARLINRLIAAGKDYDLLIFPDERHSPRRLRDRIYMEQRISDYFAKHLLCNGGDASNGGNRAAPPVAVRTMAGHL